MMDIEKDVEIYYMLHVDTNGQITSDQEKAYLKEDIDWFLQKQKEEWVQWLNKIVDNDNDFNGVPLLELAEKKLDELNGDIAK